MKKRSRLAIVLCALGLLVAGAGFALLFSVPAECGYVTAAPAFSQDATVETELTKLGEALEGIWTLSLRTQGAEVSSERGGVQSATIYAVGDGYFDLCHETLEEGRLLNETDAGEAAAMINRKGAETLLPGVNPLGQRLRIGESSVEIVGVTAGGLRLGETEETLVFVPLTMANTGKLSPQTMEIRSGAPGREEKILFAAAIRKLYPGGTLHDDARLRLGAMMPLWLIGGVLCCAALTILLQKIGSLTRQERDRLRGNLEEKYFSQLAPGAIGRGFLLFALFAVWIGAAWLVLRGAVYPLYTFTDWIPESPVDPASVWKTVKSLLTGAAVSAEYQTRAAGATAICAALIRAGSLMLLAGLILARRRKAA